MADKTKVLNKHKLPYHYRHHFYFLYFMNLSTENESLALASRFINNTYCPIFLTGKAGTGKTTFLRHIVSNTHKKTIVAAPTGIAAINAGGVTLHSLFQLPFGAFIPHDTISHSNNYSYKLNTPNSLIKDLQMHESKRKLIRELELLIIDEVSMLRADLLDAIDHVLRYVRRNSKPFGGVQLLFIGDLLQLPPVVKDEEWQQLKNFYKGINFFNAMALQEQEPVIIELDKIYRQSDQTFIDLLNHVRDNKMSAAEIDLLNQHYKPIFTADQGKGYIHLTTHNHKADKINSKALQELPSASVFFKASITGDFSEYAQPVDASLELKKGAQVMFLKNDPTGERRYFNGKIGFITQLSSDKIEVSFNDNSAAVSVEKYTWENKKYALNQSSNEIEENVVGTFVQYPLKLAWAITVHKSQGLTFEKAIIDISDAFAPGQVYVALSRLTSLEGLVLNAPIAPTFFRQDENIATFSSQKPTNETLHHRLEDESMHYFKEYLVQSFDFHKLHQQYQYHLNSYSQEGEKATKFPYKDWAIEIMTQLQPLKDVADKFKIKLNNLVEANQKTNLPVILERITSAKEYFDPLFKIISDKILEQVEALKKKSKTKAYTKELQEIELLFFNQMQRIHKAESMLKANINNIEFSKASMQNAAREERMQSVDAKVEFKPKRAKKEAGEKNAPKINTKDVSLKLYQAGKTIAEIAAERSLSITTIEGHIAYYVSTGELDIHAFMSPGKLDIIIDTLHKSDLSLLAPIKEALGEDYSYGEIKLAMAYLEKSKIS